MVRTRVFWCQSLFNTSERIWIVQAETDWAMGGAVTNTRAEARHVAKKLKEGRLLIEDL